MRKLSILLLMAAVMISYEKEDDTNNENNGPDLPDDSGQVTVKVADNAGNPVEDADVEIASADMNQILFSESTGKNL